MDEPIFRLYHTCTPVALYTYETAHAQNIIMKINNSLDQNKFIADLVVEHFGLRHMYNKITIECELLMDTVDLKTKQLVYFTYWDGVLYIGLSARFNKDFIKPGNEYRKIWAKHLKPS